MASSEQVTSSRRRYNQWVANETLEDFALRHTAHRARRWSRVRIANTALGIVSFLALEAIGGAITLQYGFTNAMWAILAVNALIFLFGLPVCYHAARSGLDIDLLTRGAGFGYIGSTVCSLIYASFTFIFFALEAAIMSMALQMLLGIPLALAYVVSALAVIPLATHGISRIGRFQLWSQPLWLLLQVAPLLFIVYHNAGAVSDWLAFRGEAGVAGGRFDLLLFGAAAAVIFPLVAQNGEQVDFLRFLPNEERPSGRWWAALVISGPGWTLFGVAKLFAGSFLAVLALRHGIPAELADDPAHMYRMAFGYLTGNPTLALVLATVFVIVSQLKINVTNAYAGSLAWSNFFSRLTRNHPGRIVWLVFNVAIALLLMELGLYHTFESILVTYSSLVLAWIGSLVADLVVNRALGLRPREIEFKRGRLYDINPVGVGSMAIASTLGVTGQLGWFGPVFQALSPFIALFTPFITAPLIARLTAGRYYLVATAATSGGSREAVCAICENRFGAEDSLHCPAHGDTVCSLCCALDSDCGDRCRPGASLQAQTRRFLEAFLPGALVDRLHSTVGQFLVILALIATLTAGLFTLAYHALGPQTPDADTLVRGLLVQIFLLLTTVTGILVWLYVLAQESRRGALAASRQHTRRLAAEAAAHRRTAAELQAAKEEAVSANRAKSRYLSGVSHELRTPLNSLLGYAQLLEMDTGLSERNRQAAAVIRRSGEHLADIIEGLLDISKIEARRLDLHRGRIRLPALLDQLVEMFGVQARAKGLAFHYSVEGPIPPYVITDEKRLRQILMNLLSNAVKFTREGSVSLHLAYRSEVARFVIADTGVGIRPGDRERIFKPFERVRDEQTRAISGTGLGLAISRLLSTLMGGDLALESEPGRGSTFTLSILLPRAGEPEQPAAGKRRMTGYKGARRRVMVVDDEPSHRALITDALVPLGFRVSGASGGDAALRLARERGCDLYLLDVRMPDMDGWELARRLRSAGVTAPIIMLSGNAIEDHREQLTVPVHDGYLIKPIAIEDLREKIACLLSLEWTHRRETVEPGSPPAALEPPPRLAAGRPPESGELVELIGMARIGYLNGVIGELASLEKRGIDPAFIGELRAMALACNFDALVRSAAAGEGE